MRSNTRPAFDVEPEPRRSALVDRDHAEVGLKAGAHRSRLFRLPPEVFEIATAGAHRDVSYLRYSRRALARAIGQENRRRRGSGIR